MRATPRPNQNLVREIAQIGLANAQLPEKKGLDFSRDQSVSGRQEVEKMRQQSADRAMDLLKHALFDAIERAHELVTRSPSPDSTAYVRRLKSIGQAGTEISAITTVLQLVEQRRKQRKP